MPDAEAAPAPVVTIRKPTRIKKEDMPPKEEPAPERKRSRRDDAPF
jgi:myo-inositol-1(or 4)-monophosphatase